MYKVTITQSGFREVTFEYECRNDAFDLMKKIMDGVTKNEKTKLAIEITEGGEE